MKKTDFQLFRSERADALHRIWWIFIVIWTSDLGQLGILQFGIVYWDTVWVIEHAHYSLAVIFKRFSKMVAELRAKSI